MGRGGGDARDRAGEPARADRGPLARPEAGADPEVRLRLLQRRGGEDPPEERGRDQVAPAPRARLSPPSDRLVPRPAMHAGFWPAGTRRAATSSVAPISSDMDALCVLASLGASEPEAR